MRWGPGKGRAAGESGAAAVEFAIVLPLLLLILTGILGFGRVYNVQIALSAAAREGARVLVVSGDAALAQAAAIAAAPGVTPAPTIAIAGGCPVGSAAGGATTQVIATRALPVTIVGWGTQTLSLQGRAVMRCER